MAASEGSPTRASHAGHAGHLNAAQMKAKEESRRELERLLENDLLEVEVLQENLTKSIWLNDKINAMINSFDHRLENLEQSIIPIHSATQSLTRGKDNISKALNQVGQVLAYLDLAAKVEPQLAKAPARTDLVEYLNVLEETKSALLFLQASPYKSSERGVQALREVLRKASVALNQLFRSLIIELCTQSTSQHVASNTTASAATTTTTTMAGAGSEATAAAAARPAPQLLPVEAFLGLPAGTPAATVTQPGGPLNTNIKAAISYLLVTVPAAKNAVATTTTAEPNPALPAPIVTGREGSKPPPPGSTGSNGTQPPPIPANYPPNAVVPPSPSPPDVAIVRDAETVTTELITFSDVDAVDGATSLGLGPLAVSYTKTYTDVRGAALQRLLGPSLQYAKDIDAQRSLIYERGTSPLVAIAAFAMPFFRAERELAQRVLPKAAVPDSFVLAITPCMTQLLAFMRSTIQRTRRALEKAEFTDIYMLLDVIQGLSTLSKAYHGIITAAAALGLEWFELIGLAKRTAIEFFPRLYDSVVQESQGSRATATAPDAIVHEMTSVALNTLRRLVEYQPAMAALLQEGGGPILVKYVLPTGSMGASGHGATAASVGMSSGSVLSDWSTQLGTSSSSGGGGNDVHRSSDGALTGGGTDAVMSHGRGTPHEMTKRSVQVPTFTAFCIEMLSALAMSLMVKSRAYKRTTLAMLFLLNNFHFIHKQLFEGPLASVVEAKVVAEAQKETARWQNAYLDTWKPILDVLLDQHFVQGTKTLSKPQRGTIKEAWKTFNDQFDDIIKSQSAATIAEPALRAQVLTEVQRTLLPVYQRFYDRYTTIEFSKTPEKYIKYTRAQIQELVSGLFSKY